MSEENKLFEEQLIQLADAIIDGGYYSTYFCSFFSEFIGKSQDFLYTCYMSLVFVWRNG